EGGHAVARREGPQDRPSQAHRRPPAVVVRTCADQGRGAPHAPRLAAHRGLSSAALSAAAFAPSSRPPLVMTPLRWVVVMAACGVALIAASGVVAEHAFAQPSTLKYLITVGGPTLVAVLALVDRPLWLLSGVA